MDSNDSQFQLSPHDAAALDALIESGWDPRRVPPELAERAALAAGFLGMLPPALSAEAGLTDATLILAVRGGRRSDPRLSSHDSLALESLVMAGFDASRVPHSLRPRAERHAALAAIATCGAAPAADGLLDRTLARIQAHIDAQESRMVIDPPRRSSGIRLADLVSVAAVLLIGASLVWPVAAGVREQSRRTACHAHLGNLASAFGRYAMDHDAALPAIARTLDGSAYWNVGDPRGRSNSANLYHLARTGYTSLEAMACPGNPAALTEALRDNAVDWPSSECVSYSYQNMFGDEQPAWSAPSVGVVLSDRSPVIVRTLRGEWIDPFENSLNHAGRGQHILFADGSGSWTTRAELPSGDMLWLPRPIEEIIRHVMRRQPSPLKGSETPVDETDAFVVP